MAKTCKHPGCTNPVFSKLYCLFHQYIIKKPQRIAAVSKKQAEKLKEYTRLRIDFLKVRPKCEAALSGCIKRATQIHHRAGRGRYLLEVITWMAICQNCHSKVHDRMGVDEAIKTGLRIKKT
ncbi:hypothetical protein [Dyadobacter sp. CY261]|uniref:hypothetical protein n=1 Tax=Dyadobacter sp. CY261 TaxID=2907203 RepID=UPI001F27B8C0|nr:hypothetical protein [Dyadobacter sp. CY261]